MAIKRALALVLTTLLAAACSRRGLPLPGLSDKPALAAAIRRPLPEQIPGYGIAVAGGDRLRFEVNIEAEDSPAVATGQDAVVFAPPDRRPIACRVSRVLRHVSEETGQSIAWLVPVEPAQVPVNEFVYANITVRVRRQALTVPAAAVLVRYGRLFVVKAAAAKFAAVEVSTGAASGADVEIRSGLSAGDRVVVRGGVGLLYPDFKSQGED
jgi:hypothetical protein